MTLPTARDALEGARPMSIAFLLIRQRRELAFAFALVMTLGVLYIVFRPARWTAESHARPQTNQNSNNRLAGLAAQFGVAVPLGGSDPVRLYLEIAESHQLRKAVLLARFPRSEGDSLPLIDLLNVKAATEDLRITKGVEKLRRIIDVLPSEQVGTLRVRVRTKWPRVSELVNRRVLELLDDITMQMRQRQASAERRFIEGRMDEAQSALRAAEDSLLMFSKTNRIASSPALTATQGRLQRQVDFRQQVFVGLAQSHEQARIDEVRNTPVLGIIDPPEGTARNENRPRDLLMWALLAVLTGVAFVIVKASVLNWAGAHPTEWDTLNGLLPRRDSAGRASAHAGAGQRA